MHAGTGNDQVTNSRQSTEGLEFSAHCHPEPRYFRKASGNQRSLRIVSVAESVGNTRSERHDIFECSTELHTKNIRADIDTECFIHKKILDVFRRLL